MDRKSREVSREEVEHAEHDEDVDVLAVHRQAFRETGDPVEGTETGPWWYWVCGVLALVFGGFYMGRYTGLFQGAPAVHAPVGPRAMMEARSAGRPGPAGPVNGATVYSGTCAACHQSSGEGAAGLFPPLAGSEYVTGDPIRLIHMVLQGLTGPVTVNGATYNGQMPPWQQLSDAELGAVLSYIRRSWGNTAAEVTTEDVARERAATATRSGPWTIGELGN